MKFLTAVTISLCLLAPATASEKRRLRQGENNYGVGVGSGQDGHPGKGLGQKPGFLDGEDLPPGLVDNPSGAVGVKFKPGRKPKVQRNPNWANGKSKLLGIDNNVIDLDLDAAQPINVFAPEQFKESEDGKFVTNIETGEIIPLTVFFLSDEKKGMDIKFATDEDGNIFNVRAKPKIRDEEDEAIEAKIQNFQTIPGTNMLAAYTDDDVDLSDAPSFGDIPTSTLEKPLPPSFTQKLNGVDGGGRTRALYGSDLEQTKKSDKMEVENPRDKSRRTQASYSVTLFGRTCTSWDWLDVRIATDQLFAATYSNHQSRAQAIFAEAAEIYWNESCVRLYMWSYGHTVGNTDYTLDIPIFWTTISLPWDSYANGLPSGCTADYGGLDLLKALGQQNFAGAYRDAFHMFTGINFTDGSTVGCAWIDACKSEEWGYGVNDMTWTTSLRFQGVEFAHELGHNLGLGHNSCTSPFRWVMCPSINSAVWDLHPTDASNVRSDVVDSSSCGWY